VTLCRRILFSLWLVCLLIPGMFPGRAADPPRATGGSQGNAPAGPAEVPAGKPKALPPQAAPLFPECLKALTWRCIGPAAMGGRVTALAVVEADPTAYWVATASGGLLRTVNNGTTFEHQFDHENTVSIGDVCVSQAERNLLWVGTGENNPRNSVSYGDGVYKSCDGGKTWKHMGLKKSFQIGRIAIHPRDPNTVYVGALGSLYGPNPERGLFKTTDGGATWQKVLFVDDRTGVIDVQMSPTDPETLLVATWERQRDEFDSHPGSDLPPADGYDRYDPIKKWGPGSGLFKTTDGGRSFRKISAGLPTCQLGRIGLCYHRKNPRIVFAIVESEKIGTGPPPIVLGVQAEKVDGGVRLARILEKSPAARAELKPGDIVTALDGKPVKTVEEFTHSIEVHKVGDRVTLTVRRDKKTMDVTITLEARPETEEGKFPPVLLGLQTQPAEKGVRVSAVTPDGAAARAGVLVDDVIVALDKKDIKDSRQLLETLRSYKPGDRVVVWVQRGQARTGLAVTLAARRRPDRPSARRPYGAALGSQRENVQHQQGPDGFQCGGVYRSSDGGETWTRVNSLNPRPMYFSQIRVDPVDENLVYVLGVALYRSSDGGKRFTPDGGKGVHADQHALWIDPRDGRHMIVGCDGGIYTTYDRMINWDFLNTTAIGQFYHVAVDLRRPYHVYGGLQDNGSWYGPSRTLHARGPINEDWIMIGGGDGFVCQADATDADVVYCEMQNGGMQRRNLRTGQRADICPRAPDGAPSYRFNWNTPFLLSRHNSRIVYSAGNFVFRSFSRGDNPHVLSPEITRTKRGSASALAESPRNPDILWVGTDDGFLWVTRNGGKDWTNVSKRLSLPGPKKGTVPLNSGGLSPFSAGPRWVASIEASRYADGRAYVVFDGHRSDDYAPYVWMTEDFGQSWKSLRSNLPEGSTRVLREDGSNPDLLYLGTEFAAWVSLDRGGSWSKLNSNLPTVAIHELAVHPTAGELVAATHGRSLWILDVTPLRQMTPEVSKARAHLFRSAPAVLWRQGLPRGTTYAGGSRRFVGQNPPPGAQVYYALAGKANKINLKIVDFDGKTMQELPVKNERGLH
jgi:photosystem II stability/assembly factor-like uncharacterized protein